MRTTIEFTRTAMPYTAGQRATFEPDHAARLVRAGAGRIVDGPATERVSRPVPPASGVVADPPEPPDPPVHLTTAIQGGHRRKG